MFYQVMRGIEVVQVIEVQRGEKMVLRKVREPSALGTAPYDPLIDIAYEQIKKGAGRDMDRDLIARIGGMDKVEALRAQR